MRFEIKKGLFGGYTIGYDCPHCGEVLKSPLDDAGKSDFCPSCNRQFVVPGLQEARKIRAEQEASAKRKDSAIAKTKDVIIAEPVSQVLYQRVRPRPISTETCILGAFSGGLIGVVTGWLIACAGAAILMNAVPFRITFFGVWLIFVLCCSAFGWMLATSKEQARIANEERAIQSAASGLLILLHNSQEQFLRLPTIVHDAHQYLDMADREFDEGAFAPFWDQIENATKKLAAYDMALKQIERNADSYKREAPQHGLPQFVLPAIELPDPRPTSNRLANSVRRAQKNFQFATIFEQRKTNKVLVDGFSTLSAAIDDMGAILSGRIGDLSATLNGTLECMLVEMSASDASHRSYEKKALAMLDDIRRGERPLF